MVVVNDLVPPSTEMKISYRLGDVAKSNDMRASESEKENVLRASLLKEGDGAFVRRSDGTWRFAIVQRKALGKAPRIDFDVNENETGCDSKSLSLVHWATSVRTLRGSSSSKLDQFVDSLVSYLEIAEKKEGKNVYLKELALLVPTKFQYLLEEDASELPPLSEVIVTRRVPRRAQNSSSDLFCSTTTMHGAPAATREYSGQHKEKMKLFSEAKPIEQMGPRASKIGQSNGARNLGRGSFRDMPSDQGVKHGQRKARRRPRVTVDPMTNGKGRKCNRQCTASVKPYKAIFQSLFEECMLKPVTRPSA